MLNFAKPIDPVKKIAAAILLIPLLLNGSGYHFYFTLKRIALRTEMRSFLSRSRGSRYTEDFIFRTDAAGNVPGLEWEGDDEFRYKGDMYDIIEKKIEGDVLTVRCISDEKETSLLKDYEAASRNDFGHPSSRNKFAHWLKLASALFTIPISIAYPSGINRLPEFQPRLCGVYHALEADIPTPPPWRSS